MWVYQKVTYPKPFGKGGDQTRYDVGYYAVPEGEEYGNRMRFNAVRSFYGDTGEQQARREVHYLNGGNF